MQLFSFTLPGWVNPADAFCLLYGNDEAAFWLDREHHPEAPISVLGHAHRDVFSNLTDALTALEQLRAALDTDGAAPELPFDFRPGLVGWLEYLDAGVSPADTAAGLLLVREALVFDHAKRNITIIGVFETEAKFKHWVQGVILRIWFSGGQQVGYQMRVETTQPHPPLAARTGGADYLELVIEAQRRIAAGEVYQLCLTNRLSGQTNRDPLATFLQLRKHNPSPYASFVRIGDRALVSSSPEQFLKLDSAGRLVTKPIKGTRARRTDETEDQAIRKELASDAKERAENLMIVDLMRNDLGRVSEAESVAVPKLFEVETYATVHQLVSTVTAKKRTDASTAEVLAATFPAGSMTGAPKLRAMELIAAFEGEPRGVYSGLAGWFGIDGAFELAMNIRCLVFDGGRVSIGVGGGITSDSVPELELEETKIKAAALLRALDASCDW